MPRESPVQSPVLIMGGKRTRTQRRGKHPHSHLWSVGHASSCYVDTMRNIDQLRAEPGPQEVPQSALPAVLWLPNQAPDIFKVVIV